MLRKILCVDDDLGTRLLAKTALERIGGFDVFGASSGFEALRAAPLFKPDLLLIDLMMPEMSGLETVAKLKELGINAPVILMTAESAKLELLSDFYVIKKPFDPMELSSLVFGAYEKLVTK